MDIVSSTIPALSSYMMLYSRPSEENSPSGTQESGIDMTMFNPDVYASRSVSLPTTGHKT